MRYSCLVVILQERMVVVQHDWHMNVSLRYGVKVLACNGEAMLCQPCKVV